MLADIFFATAVLFMILLVLMYIIEIPKLQDKVRNILGIVFTILIILFYFLSQLELKLEEKKMKKEYIMKIEKILIKENNPQRELIIEELNKKELDFLEKYYLENLKLN